MEVDSGAGKVYNPLISIQPKSTGVCKLQSSTVSLQQYDETPLIVVGECFLSIITQVVVDVYNQLPLLGKDWMVEVQFDVSRLINQAMQILRISELHWLQKY